MSGVTGQNEIAAMEARDQVGILRAPQIHARKIRQAEEMRNRLCPVSYQFLHKSTTGISAVAVGIGRGRKTLSVNLHIPYDVHSIHGQDAAGNAAAFGMKFIEIVAGPSDSVFTVRHAND